MSKPRKQATNVSIDRELLAKARSLGVNLSRALEEKLIELVTEAERAAWRRRNRAAIETYNARVAGEAILSDDERLF